ncbi:MAG: hypothetical protein C5B52_12630 [Bacteroidetes bacterium]|nr:MAG: hypothetical protein C5B52_12630 [Bacteroidota bacterium]
MERIGLLINKLQELYQQKASSDQLLYVLQMLQAELTQLKQSSQTATEKKKIAVFMPSGITVTSREVVFQTTEQPAEVLKVDEKAIAAEIEAIQRAAAQKEQAAVVPIPAPNSRYNVLEEVPTLAHQPNVKELNEVIGDLKTSLNEKLNDSRTELADKLQDSPVKDIKKAIGVNDRFIFIMELFRGDEAMYERSLKTINHFMIFPEAEFWIQRELKLKLGWNEDHPAVQQFDQIVRRRFL